MRNNNSFLLSMILCITILFSCGTVRYSAPSRVGILPLESYQVSSALLQTDTTYKVIRNENEFSTAFSSADPVARRPGFDGQMVVAILFPKPVANALQFQSAEVTGGTLVIHAVNCTSPDCQPQQQALLATVPKVGNVTKARFVINGEEKAQVRW